MVSHDMMGIATLNPSYMLAVVQLRKDDETPGALNPRADGGAIRRAFQKVSLPEFQHAPVGDSCWYPSLP